MFAGACQHGSVDLADLAAKLNSFHTTSCQARPEYGLHANSGKLQTEVHSMLIGETLAARHLAR